MTRSRNFRSIPARRRNSWEVGPETGVNGDSQAVSASGQFLATTAVRVLQDGLTIVRTRGDLNLILQTADGGASGFHGAFGIGIFNFNAVNTGGISSLLTPLADENWDGWLYHRYFSLFPGAAVAAAASQDTDQVNATTAALHIEVDSKAMRKTQQDDSVVAILDVVEVGVCAMRWAFNCRQLLKLP